MRLVVLSLLMLVSATAAADPAPKPIPGLKAAQDAYDKELLIAKELHSRTVREARAEYVKALKAIQTERTKAGDLDGAIKLKEMIAGVDSEEMAESSSKELQARAKLSSAISGRVWSTDPGSKGWGESFVFKPDGFVYSPPSAARPGWQWSAVGSDSVAVVSGTGVVDVFIFSADRKKITVAPVGGIAQSSGKWAASSRSK